MAWVAVSAGVSGVAGYLVLLIAARILGPADYSWFAVFWAVCFTAVGFLFGLQQEVTRIARLAVSGSPGSGPRVLVVAGVLGAVVALFVAATAPLWGPPSLGGGWPLSAGLIAVAAVAAAGEFAVTGALGGSGRWRAYSAVIISEVASRLALVGVAALLVPTELWFAAAAAVAFAVWPIVLAVARRTRAGLLTLRSDTSWRWTLFRLVQTMLASGASGFLINGFPAILSTVVLVTAPGTGAARLGVLILLITVLRAPLMLPLLAFTSTLVARFVGLAARERRSALRGPLLLVVALGLGLAGLAALIVPPLVPLLVGESFQAAPLLAAALTASSIGLGVITVTGAAAVAAERHFAYLLGWAVATTVVIALLVAVPVALEWRCVLALAAGPLPGAVVHVMTLSRRVSPTTPTAS